MKFGPVPSGKDSTGLSLLCEKLRPANACEAGRAGYDHVVGAAGTVDDLEVAGPVPAADDADVGSLRVEY